MTAKQRIELCPTCKHDGGWHFDDPDHPTRPHHEAAALREQARALAELAHSDQLSKAHEIIAEAAHELFEFSANNVRDKFNAEGVPESLRSAAFTWAQSEGLIVPTGRRVMSTDPTTRHAVNVWRSVERARTLGVAS